MAKTSHFFFLYHCHLHNVSKLTCYAARRNIVRNVSGPDLGQEQKYGGDVTDRRIQNLHSNNIGKIKTNSNI